MEEILASIRRIIEDSDVTRQMPVKELPIEKPVARGEVAQFRRPETEVEEPNASGSSRSFERPLLQEKTITAPPASTEPVRSSVISAVSAAIERPETVVLDSSASLRGSLDNDAEQVEYVAVKPVPANDATVGADLVQSETKATVADLTIREKVEESVENDIQKIISEMMEGQPQETDGRSSAPLASVSTKQQVSASFSELSEAVRQERIRSLEEQAEALLRPMLQNWLDENLPSMVERLVREEIERMVRGDQH